MLRVELRQTLLSLPDRWCCGGGEGWAGGEEIRSAVKYYHYPQEGRCWIGPTRAGEDPHRAKNVSFKRSPRRDNPGM